MLPFSIGRGLESFVSHSGESRREGERFRNDKLAYRRSKLRAHYSAALDGAPNFIMSLSSWQLIT